MCFFFFVFFSCFCFSISLCCAVPVTQNARFFRCCVAAPLAARRCFPPSTLSQHTAVRPLVCLCVYCTRLRLANWCFKTGRRPAMPKIFAYLWDTQANFCSIKFLFSEKSFVRISRQQFSLTFSSGKTAKII